MSIKGKAVYVVRGSEDGNLGVYTSEAKAVKRARVYMEQAGEKYNAIWQSKTCLIAVTFESKGRDPVTASVERFYLQ